jgi:iron complex outermembrane recepter protein
MRLSFPIPVLLFLAGTHSFAQQDTLRTNQLEEVTVRAFESQRSRLETTASVGVLTPKTLNRFAPITFTNAVNTIPGIRMEERSPGSYRFSVRGSLLRSPFGVRNVKFYWNGIPYTDANGNTPLNSLDFASIDRMEIIKGPGSSVYGAGTGGVVLLSSDQTDGQNKVEQSFGVGKYGFQSRNTQLTLGDVSVRYGHQQQEGYRQQSGMVRDVLQFNATTRVGSKATLSLLGMYSDLHYQTPGGINLDQYRNDPTLARQPTPTLPGSVTQNAGIYTKYSFWGIQHQMPLSSHWEQSLSVYISTNDFANPFITNYEKRNEQGLGGRNVWTYAKYYGQNSIQWTSGFEWQYGKSAQRNYNNDKGRPAGFQTSEDIRSTGATVFTQAEARLPGAFILSAGASLNTFQFGYERFFPTPYTEEKRRFDNVISPRVALNKTFLKNWSVTGSLSSGYSPPTIQEVRPSAGGFRQDLTPEFGINKEISVRRVGDRFKLDLNAYQFNLRETIVRRTNEAGAEFFVNAGQTDQKGLEWRLDYPLLKNVAFLDQVAIWNAGTLVSYEYQSYQQGATDFTGNKLPGIPSFTQNTGLDILMKAGFAAYFTYQYVDGMYLNDANTVEVPSFNQFLVRVSWNRKWGRHLTTELSASGEWVNADIYSLGYDLNAFGNRYYNAAPKQNLWVGVKAGWVW